MCLRCSYDKESPLKHKKGDDEKGEARVHINDTEDHAAEVEDPTLSLQILIPH